jgi:5-methylcytosine-specific restriction endonuclease McrA
MTRVGLIIFSLTAFLIADTYHDGKYTKLVKSWKKYYQMAFIGFLGLSAYLFIKKHPNQSKSLMVHANELIKYMPIDKEAGDLLSPLLDMTNNSVFSKELYNENYYAPNNYNRHSQEKKILNSGKTGTKRSVSETKKKYVASQQNWKCGKCNQQLSAWFEVDHKVRLERGGSNEVSNLVALCRECHGEKTAMENL